MICKTKESRSYRKTLACAALIGMTLGVGTAMAGPEGAQVVHGAASINQAGNVTNITTSHQAIINYSKFNIGPSETVNFIQPGASSRVLNRINSVRPTVIEGRLNANGSVYFVNPQGVRFTNGAVVNVGSIFAAAGSMSNQDFLAGHDRFTALSGSVVNEGLINAREVGMVGQRVINQGQINLADSGGLIAMAAGDQVIIARHGSHISVEVNNDNPTANSALGAGDLGALAMAVPVGEPGGYVHQGGGIAVPTGPTGADMVVAGSDVLIDTAVAGVKNYTVNATSSITFDVAGVAVDSSQTQTYNVDGMGPINLAQDTTLNGTAVRFNGSLFSTKPGTPATLTVNGSADFNGPVGGTNGGMYSIAMPLKSIDVTGTTNIAGGHITTTMDQDYRGVVNLVNDTTLNSGTEVHFHKAVADASADTKGVGVGADLVINSPITYFDSRVSTSTDAGRIVGSLWVNGVTVVNNRGSVGVLVPNRFTTRRDQVFNGPFVITEDAFLKSFTGDIRFLSTVDAAPSQFAAGILELPDRNGNATSAGLTVRAIEGNVQFAGDVGLNGGQYSEVNKPLAHLIVVAAPHLDKLISFGSVLNPVMTRPGPTDDQFLGESDSAIAVPTTSGLHVLVDGDIMLNPSMADLNERGLPIVDGEHVTLPFIPQIATIESRDGTAHIQSRHGALYMGQNNKFTSAGDLHLIGYDILKVGDLNAVGNIRVAIEQLVQVAEPVAVPTGTTMTAIFLRTRDDSNLYDFEGNLTGPRSEDVNLDLVSNGLVDFSLVPILENGGSPIFVGSPMGAGADPSGNLAAAGAQFITQSRGANEFFLGVPAGQFPVGQTLDMTPFQDTPLNERAFILSGPLPFQDRVIREPLLAPADQQFMAGAMSMQSRPLASNEYATGLNRIRVFNDGAGPLVANANAPATVVALNRVRRGSAEQAIAAMQGVTFGTPGATATDVDRRAQVKAAINDAWNAYRQADPQADFMQYLATTEAHADHYRQLQQVADMLGRMKKTGVTNLEYAIFANAALAPLTPEGMTVQQLHENLTGQPLVSRGTAMRTATNER